MATADEPALLSIGLFSRSSFLSIKALRAYHEAGILVPARIDPSTGYRSYDVSQLADAAIIRRLRQLDLPLEQVRVVVDAHDPEVTRRVLEQHQVQMAARLEETERIVAELQAGVEDPRPHTPVYIRPVPGSHTLAVRGHVTAETFATFLDAAFERLYAVAEQVGAEVDGSPGGLYSQEILDDESEPVEAYLPIREPVALTAVPAAGGALPVVLSELAAVSAAVLVHSGSYDSIADAYQMLGAWVARRGLTLDAKVRESYLVSYGETDDVEEFRTEIQWPVHAPDPHVRNTDVPRTKGARP
jgi:DNA-binding transcriptional MerR regulator